MAELKDWRGSQAEMPLERSWTLEFGFMGFFDNLIRVGVALSRDTVDDMILECAVAAGAKLPTKTPGLAVSNAAIAEA